MTWYPKLVALDVDGTLVDDDNIVTPETYAAVRRVVDAGVPAILSTGRSWLSALTVLEQLPMEKALHVCSNGALIASYPPFEVVEVTRFDARRVVEQVLAEHPTALFAAEVIGQGYRVSQEFPTGELHGTIEVVPVEELWAEPVTRIVVRDPNASEHEFIELAERLGLTGVSYFIGYTAWLDIAPEGVDKAHGLIRVCDRLGVDAADVLAIGDGRNDIEMLEWAGRGVAMGNAPDEVKAIADAVTGAQRDGGLVDELDRWFAPRMSAD